MCIPGLGYVLSWMVTLHWSVYIPGIGVSLCLTSVFCVYSGIGVCFALNGNITAVCIPGIGMCCVSLCLTSTFHVYSRIGVCLSWTVTLQWSVCIPRLVYVCFVLNSNITVVCVHSRIDVCLFCLEQLHILQWSVCTAGAGLSGSGSTQVRSHGPGTEVWRVGLVWPHPLCDPAPVWPCPCVTPSLHDPAPAAPHNT